MVLMNIEEYRGWFVVGSLALILLATTPTLALFIHIPSSSEEFSELWLLGQGHKAEDYPFNVRIIENYSVYVGVGNHLGYSAYYRIDVKFRNQTQPLPNSTNSMPSSLNSTYEFQFFVADGKTWESLVTFSLQGERTFINSVLIGDIAFPVNSSSTRDQERNGFYYQLFFELWLYNMTAQSFQYHNRFVSLWLNVTD